MADRPRVFSTFMMWLLAELFEALPEVGDLDRPKLVFFFDEAHLLFDGASKAFVDQVQRTVRLIRSKGVGVFFITQLPQDLPDEVLAQLGNRVQHALRAITPKDAAAIDKTVQTYPMTEVYDLASALTSLGVGEAVVTVLSPTGVPTPVAWTRLYPPASRMAPADPATVQAAVAGSAIHARYREPVDPDSAYERLSARLQQAQAPAPQDGVDTPRPDPDGQDGPAVHEHPGRPPDPALHLRHPAQTPLAVHPWGPGFSGPSPWAPAPCTHLARESALGAPVVTNSVRSGQ